MALGVVLRKISEPAEKSCVKALVGLGFIAVGLACGLSGSLSTFLLLPPPLLSGILWLAFAVNRRVLGFILIALLFLPMLLGGPPIIFPFLPPLLFLTIPYLVIAAVFIAGKKLRGVIDIVLIIVCVGILLPSTPGPGYYLWVAGGLQPAMLSTFGNATLEVQVLAPDNLPVTGLEVDLWLASTAGGPPDAGRETTDDSGVASFRVIAGSYRIGFNMLNFPENYVAIQENVDLGAEGFQKIIRLHS